MAKKRTRTRVSSKIDELPEALRVKVDVMLADTSNTYEYISQYLKQEGYNGLMAHEDVIPIPIKGQLSKEVFNKIFRAMTRDNPLIYYVNQSACNWATDAFGHTAICPQYFYSRETVRKYNRMLIRVRKWIRFLRSALLQINLGRCILQEWIMSY